MDPEQSSTENVEELIVSSTLSNSIQISVSDQFESKKDAQSLADARCWLSWFAQCDEYP